MIVAINGWLINKFYFTRVFFEERRRVSFNVIIKCNEWHEYYSLVETRGNNERDRIHRWVKILQTISFDFRTGKKNERVALFYDAALNRDRRLIMTRMHTDCICSRFYSWQVHNAQPRGQWNKRAPRENHLMTRAFAKRIAIAKDARINVCLMQLFLSLSSFLFISLYSLSELLHGVEIIVDF